MLHTSELGRIKGDKEEWGMYDMERSWRDLYTCAQPLVAFLPLWYVF